MARVLQRLHTALFARHVWCSSHRERVVALLHRERQSPSRGAIASAGFIQPQIESIDSEKSPQEGRDGCR